MATVIVCPDPNYPTPGLLSPYAAGCFDSLGQPQQSGAGVTLTVDQSISDLSQRDVEGLLSAALVVLALAWGFRVVGRLLFRG